MVEHVVQTLQLLFKLVYVTGKAA